MSKLYEIAKDYTKIMDSGLPLEIIADTIEGIEGELTDKIEQLLSIIKNERYYSDSLKQEAKSLSERASVVDNKIESIKDYIISSLETAGKKSIRAGLHQVTVRVPSKQVDIIDESLIPVEYIEYETKVKIDKLAIKHKLTNGDLVPGAKIKIGKPSLLIK